MTSKEPLAFCEVRGLLNNLNDNLAGKQAAMWTEALRRMLRRENPWGGEAQGFTPFLSVTRAEIEKMATVRDVAQHLHLGQRLSRDALTLIGSIADRAVALPELLELVLVSPQEMGTVRNPTTRQVFERAAQCGLLPFPGGYAPYFVTALRDEAIMREVERITVGMIPAGDDREMLTMELVGDEQSPRFHRFSRCTQCTPDAPHQRNVPWLFLRAPAGPSALTFDDMLSAANIARGNVNGSFGHRCLDLGLYTDDGLELWKFPRTMSTRQALRLIDREGYVNEGLERGLAHLRKPDAMRGFEKIVMFGAAPECAHQTCNVPYFFLVGNERHLDQTFVGPVGKFNQQWAALVSKKRR